MLEVLRPFFQRRGITAVDPILIRTSKTGRGGHVNFQHLFNTISGLLVSKKDDFLVTTFIDYFRIPTNMPEYKACMTLASGIHRVEALENALGKEIDDGRFIPYIQLHEFEALLFANNRGFEEFFSENQAAKTGDIVSSFRNPEEINSSVDTAPSKRILAIEEGYDKVIQGNLIALSVGIDEMLSKCPHFSSWINEIICRCRGSQDFQQTCGDN